MRITLTLDDDVAAKLKTESQHAGRPFREIVNETLRPGVGEPARRRSAARLQDNGARSRYLNPGLSLDNIAELIEHVEGSLHR
jgi:hypothetical protein